MPAIEIINVVADQKTAGTNAVLFGKMSTSSSKSGSANDFLGMMQMTMAEYQNSKENQKTNSNQESKQHQKTNSNQEPNRNHIDESIVAGSDGNGKEKIILNKKQHPAQGNGKSKEAAGDVTAGDTKSKPADENGTEQKETIGPQIFIAAINMEKLVSKLAAAGVNEKGAESLLALQEEGKRELVRPNGLLINGNADKVGKHNKDNQSSLIKKNPSLTEANANTIPEMKNQLVKALEDKGIAPEEIENILKVVEEGAVKSRPADRSLGTINEPEMKKQLVVKAPEGKEITADAIEGILKAVDELSDQAIAAKTPEVKQYPTGKSSSQVDVTSTSFKQAAVAILEKKGFSPEEIKGIMNVVDETTVVGAKPDTGHRSDQPAFIQQSLYHKEFIKEATVGGKNIHTDIYQKEASLEDFTQKSVEARIIINPLEKQTQKDGYQKELVGKPENTGRSEKKNVFSGAIRETENKKTILNDKEIDPKTTGKVITATDKDDQGKWIKMAGDVHAKTNHTSHEDITLNAGREESPLPADIMSVAAKGPDFHIEKATVDTSKSIYQTVVDQIQDGFALAHNKESGQVRLTLKPEIMGHLDMQIAVRNETVQIMMTVENEKVHQAMNAHIDDLKSALQNQGLKIDKIEVTLQYQPDQERAFYQDQAKSQFNNPGQNSHQERMSNQKLSFGDDHYPINGQEIIQKQSITEGVSIFA